jgi:HlyD family secretion protein
MAETPNLNVHNNETQFEQNVRQRADAVQEIVSHHPGFLERWALLLFLLLLVSLFIATWFIRYPDIIETGATLTAINGPKPLVPMQSGRIIRLFHNNNRRVSRGSVLAWLEATGNHFQILQLARSVDSAKVLLKKDSLSSMINLFVSDYDALGEIQAAYELFNGSWRRFDDYVISGFYKGKILMLEEDIADLRKISGAIERQKSIASENLNLAEESFKMNDQLFRDKIISKEEHRIQKSKLLNTHNEVPRLNATLLTNENLIRGKRKEIMQIEHDIIQQTQEFEQALMTIKSLLDAWIQRYTIRSPVDGVLTFIVPLQDNMLVEQGQYIGYVNPDSSTYYVEAILGQRRLGKVATGQTVQLRFDAYPFNEFGYVPGELDYISEVPTDSGFLSRICLSKGLTTNHGLTIPNKPGLKAKALIITKNERLMHRFYAEIVKITAAH